MDKQTLAIIQQKLVSKRDSIQAELDRITVKDPQGANTYNVAYPDLGNVENESVTEIETYDINLSVEQVLKSSYDDVCNALKSIETGSYGVCKYCHKPIDINRLLARPVSSSCIDCKTKLKML